MLIHGFFEFCFKKNNKKDVFYCLIVTYDNRGPPGSSIEVSHVTSPQTRHRKHGNSSHPRNDEQRAIFQECNRQFWLKQQNKTIKWLPK